MYFLVGYIFFVLLSCSRFGSTLQDETVKVSLYYESLCPYSIEFVKEQMFTGFMQLHNSLVMDLVPYGNAYRDQVDGKWEFICQHGPNECYGNKMQACVLINETLVQEQRVAFVGCIMSQSDPSSDESGQMCAEANSLSWDDIKACANGSEGDELLVHYGEITDALNPPLMYVPHILFNDAFDEALENGARENFVDTVCSLFKVKPAECSS